MRHFLFLAYALIPSYGFNAPLQSRTGQKEVQKVELNMVDPVVALTSVIGDFGIADLGIAVGGAAVGVLSQMPRINSLQEELNVTKTELAQETEKMLTKMAELDDKLHYMDRDFEEQTAKFKKRYDMEAKARLEQTVKQIRSEYQERLQARMNEIKLEKEVELDREKSKLLLNSLDAVKTVSGKSQGQLTELRFQNAAMKDMNEKLEAAIAQANEELERLRQAMAQKEKRFFGLF